VCSKKEDKAVLESQLEELDQKVEHLTTLCRASKGVVKALGYFLQDGGELPPELLLVIGGYLLDHLDAAEEPDAELKLLWQECNKRLDI